MDRGKLLKCIEAIRSSEIKSKALEVLDSRMPKVVYCAILLSTPGPRDEWSGSNDDLAHAANLFSRERFWRWGGQLFLINVSPDPYVVESKALDWSNMNSLSHVVRSGYNFLCILKLEAKDLSHSEFVGGSDDVWSKPVTPDLASQILGYRLLPIVQNKRRMYVLDVYDDSTESEDFMEGSWDLTEPDEDEDE